MEFEHQPLKQGLLTNTPLGREGPVIEVTDAVNFLTSDRTSFISGIDLRIDGGLMSALRHG